MAVAFGAAADAANVAFVGSFTSATNTQDTINLLQGAGHTVTVVPAGDVNGTLTTIHAPSGLTRKAYLETFGLVLISRASASADYTDKAGWAGLTVPVVSMNAYAVRGTDRLHWFSTAASDQIPADPDTIVTNPAHSIWTGVTLTATNTRANLYVPITGDARISGGTGTYGGGILLGTSTLGTSVSTLVLWQAGAQLASTNIAANRRVLFTGGGYTNLSATDTTQTLYNTGAFTADGDKAFLNTINWALNGDPNPDTDGDGLFDSWEITYWGNLTTARGTQAQSPALGANYDNDGDGFDNETEETAFSNPTLPLSVPGDVDGDSLLDSTEITYFGNLNQSPTGDFDGDYATNKTEIDQVSPVVSPANAGQWPDTDTDLMSDGWEVANGLSVGTDDRALDPDGDTFPNLAEFKAGTDPHNTASTPNNAILANRWSFTGNLTDSVGGKNAQIVNDTAANVGLSSFLESGTTVQLYGGARATTDYVSLGTNLLSGTQSAGVQPVTIELWATQDAIQSWSRMFNFGRNGPPNPGPNESLRMVWTQGTNINTDQVVWEGITTVNNPGNWPYVLGVPYHVVMTIVPAVFTNGAIASGCQVSWYSSPVAASPADGHPLYGQKGSFNSTSDLRALLDIAGTLGRSYTNTDPNAQATYDEMRIWKGALTEQERELFQLLGPDNIDRADADLDGFPDQWELVRFGNTTTVTVANAGVDVDGDGFSNLTELTDESNPNDVLSTPLDADKDGLGDTWERQYFRNLLQTGDQDPDNDVNTNEMEESYATDPTNANSSPDTDGDGMMDGWEYANFSDLTTADSTLRSGGIATNYDGDFDTDLQEFQLAVKTDPKNNFSGRDTEAGVGDTLPDYWEYFYFGSDPTNFYYAGANYLNTVVPAADPDADGASNKQELTDVTHPADPLSFKDINGDGVYDGIPLAASDALGATSFNAGTNWTGGAAPVAGSNYYVGSGLTLRTVPTANANTTFLGSKLTIAAGGILQLKGTTSTSSANYILSAGTIRSGEPNSTVTVAGTIKTSGSSFIEAYDGTMIITAAVSGSGDLTLRGDTRVVPNLLREVQFSNAGNTWTGNITKEPSASLTVNTPGVLAPGTGSTYNFQPKASGVNSRIGGTGTITLAGTMNIDLSAVVLTTGASWNLVSITTRTYDAGFTVVDSAALAGGFTAGTGAAGSRTWTSGDGNYAFSETTGVLSFLGTLIGYSSWSSLYAPGQTMDMDHDNDGVKNGIEYFIGQTGTTFTSNTAQGGDTVTWPIEATYTGVYGTDYEVQSSTDLVTWTAVPIGTGDNTVAVNPGPSPTRSVVYNMPTGGTSFVRLVVKN